MIDLKAFRKQKKISQIDLASLIGVSQSNISMVENGTMSYPDDWTDIISQKYPDFISNISVESGSDLIFSLERVINSKDETIKVLQDHVKTLIYSIGRDAR